MIDVTRRTFLRRTALFIAAPAIIRVANIMPVKAWDEEVWPDDEADLSEIALERLLIEIGKIRQKQEAKIRWLPEARIKFG